MTFRLFKYNDNQIQNRFKDLQMAIPQIINIYIK